MPGTTDVLIRSAQPGTVTPGVVRAVTDVILPVTSISTVSPMTYIGTTVQMNTPLVLTGVRVFAVVVTGVASFPDAIVTTAQSPSPAAVAGTASVPVPSLTTPLPQTAKQNTAEGQSSGVALAAAQTGSGDPFDQVSTVGTPTLVYDSTVHMHGAQSYHVLGAAGDQALIMYVNANDTQGALRFYVYFNAPPAAACELAQLRNATSNACKITAFPSSGSPRLEVQDALGANVYVFASVLSLGVWYRVEMESVPGTTISNGLITARYFVGDSMTPVDEFNLASVAAFNAGTANITGARYGKVTTASATLDANIDDICFAPGFAGPIGPSNAALGVTVTPVRSQGVAVIMTPTITPVKPGTSNTGIPPGTGTLTVRNGDQTISTSGTVFDKLDIHGLVTVTTSNVTIKRCIIRGNSTLGTNSGLINCTGANVVNLVIQDCLLIPDFPSLWWDGVIGHDYNIQRCNIAGTVDGLGVYNTHNSGGPVNVIATANYIHDLAYFSPDPINHGGDSPVSHTHNDICQIQGGTGIELGYNYLEGFCNSTYGPDILLDSAHKNGSGGFNAHYPYLQSSSVVQINIRGTIVVGNINFHNNWIGGGAFSINVEGGTYPNLGSITNNRFEDNQRPDSPAYISVPNAAANAVITGNVHDNNGTPVPVLRF
jgi:hypothetical protein